jgi:hypothetical protein
MRRSRAPSADGSFHHCRRRWGARRACYGRGPYGIRRPAATCLYFPVFFRDNSGVRLWSMAAAIPAPVAPPESSQGAADGGTAAGGRRRRQHRSVKPWPCTPGRAARLQPSLFFPTALGALRVMAWWSRVPTPERGGRGIWAMVSGQPFPAMRSGLIVERFDVARLPMQSGGVSAAAAMLSLPWMQAGPMTVSLSPHQAHSWPGPR